MTTKLMLSHRTKCTTAMHDLNQLWCAMHLSKCDFNCPMEITVFSFRDQDLRPNINVCTCRLGHLAFSITWSNTAAGYRYRINTLLFKKFHFVSSHFRITYFKVFKAQLFYKTDWTLQYRHCSVVIEWSKVKDNCYLDMLLKDTWMQFSCIWCFLREQPLHSIEDYSCIEFNIFVNYVVHNEIQIYEGIFL